MHFRQSSAEPLVRFSRSRGCSQSSAELDSVDLDHLLRRWTTRPLRTANAFAAGLHRGPGYDGNLGGDSTTSVGCFACLRGFRGAAGWWRGSVPREQLAPQHISCGGRWKCVESTSGSPWAGKMHALLSGGAVSVGRPAGLPAREACQPGLPASPGCLPARAACQPGLAGAAGLRAHGARSTAAQLSDAASGKSSHRTHRISPQGGASCSFFVRRCGTQVPHRTSSDMIVAPNMQPVPSRVFFRLPSSTCSSWPSLLPLRFSHRQCNLLDVKFSLIQPLRSSGLKKSTARRQPQRGQPISLVSVWLRLLLWS